MSASKKTTKVTKSPAPAIKETKTAAKPALKKAAAKTVADKTEAATAAIVAAVTRAAAPAMTEAPVAKVKEVVSSPVTTTISARVDVGFGNSLYLRGEGSGLSWDRGIRMVNLGRELWQLQLGESARPITFKFLINDETWSTGADLTIAAGSSETFTPAF